MRITALVKSLDHVCCRYRAAAFRPHFEAIGHEFAVRPWWSPSFLWQMVPGLSCDIDALIVQRKLLSSWQLNHLRRRVRWLIYDFDDSVFLRSSYNPRGTHCPTRFAQFRQIVQAADIVTAGNAFLRDQACAVTDPAKVHLIPTCVDANRYSLADHFRNRANVKLAWIGSSSTIRGLERIGDILDCVGLSVPKTSLKVICDRAISLQRLPIEFCRWSESTEIADLIDADIGVSWLPDDAWSEGKCGLKILQYMAAGLPVIANPVGMHKVLVKHGETGFLVKTVDEWIAAVRRLTSEPALRRQLGIAGRHVVERYFDVAHGAANWETVVRTLESGTRGYTGPRTK
ncbi:MAG: glycosyltransferase family 4 protein [Planctomycetes bacterium]|nr:glycosyltransferase family 4 protein [Planctomycetota bacterium]